MKLPRTIISLAAALALVVSGCGDGEAAFPDDLPAADAALVSDIEQSLTGIATFSEETNACPGEDEPCLQEAAGTLRAGLEVEVEQLQSAPRPQTACLADAKNAMTQGLEAYLRFAELAEEPDYIKAYPALQSAQADMAKAETVYEDCKQTAAG